ncbi:MAG: PQQ-binding-like beta-propeller repeat protein [Acidobacteria bacterium]|nr:PQQ-binding-like beta-propeller repeat protein [Acidobacteriota bacterium]
MQNTFALFLVTFLVTQLPTLPVTPDERLLDAAQRNDMQGVLQALEQGANVNAKARYNNTAILYASRNANYEMMKLLAERGADLTAQDTFYSRNVLSRAMTDRNVEMVRYLIEKGAPVGPELLTFAIERRDRTLIEAVLTKIKIGDALLAAMQAFHGKAGNTEASALLRAAMDKRPGVAKTLATIPAEKLQQLAGTYQQDNNTFFDGSTSHILVVSVKDGQLVATLGGRPATLFPTSELTFVAPEMPAADFRFERRGNTIERAFVLRPMRPREDPVSPYIRVSDSTTAPPSTSVAPEDFAVAPREIPRPWPSFRGTGAAGVADGQGAVAEWNAATGRNVLWKTSIPGIANASPIIWNDRAFIATAISGAGNNTFRVGDYGDTTPVRDLSEHSFKLYALDLKTGRIIWEREVHKGVPHTMRHTKGSHASPTPVTDGRRVVVLFGTAGILAAYDMNGQLLWKKDLGVLDNGFFFDPTVQWGHSSSPIIYESSVIVQADRQKDSFIAAYNLADGKELWHTEREGEIPTWGTPTVARGRSGDELVTNGTRVRGYDPKTGKLRWTLGPNSEITVATPIVGPDLVYVTAGYPPVRPIYAIRPGFTGDISLTAGAASNQAIRWSSERDGTYIPTPLFYRGLLYMLNNNGILTVFEPATGERVYRARVGLGGSYSASPVAADGRIYMASEDGEVFVIKAGREYIQLAKHEMNEVIMATPALSNGVIVIRTLHHVYGIGQ